MALICFILCALLEVYLLNTCFALKTSFNQQHNCSSMLENTKLKHLFTQKVYQNLFLSIDQCLILRWCLQCQVEKMQQKRNCSQLIKQWYNISECQYWIKTSQHCKNRVLQAHSLITVFRLPVFLIVGINAQQLKNECINFF